MNQEITNNTTEISRLRWKCRRGMLELDLLLDAFVSNTYPGMDKTSQTIFLQILEYPDQTLFDYFFGGSIPHDKDVADVIQRIRHSASD